MRYNQAREIQNEVYGVRRLHKNSGSLVERVEIRNPSARSRIPQARRSEPAKARAEAKDYKAFRFPRFKRPNLETRRFSHLAGKLCVGEFLPNDLLYRLLETTVIVHVLSIVVTEHLLIQVAEQVERLHANVGSAKAALQETPEILQSVSVDLTVNVGNGMVDNLMRVVARQSLVTEHFIGIERSASVNMLLNQWLHSVLLSVTNNSGSNLSATLENPKSNCLIFAASASNASGAGTTVHIARLTADETFVRFNFTVELPAGLSLKRKANPVHHVPSAFLSDSERTVDLPRTDTVFAVALHPDCGKPLVQAKRGIFHNGPDFDAELRFWMAGLALPHAPRRDKRHVLRSAGRANNAVRPAPRYHVIEAVVWIGKVDDGLLESLGFVFVSHDEPSLPELV